MGYNIAIDGPAGAGKSTIARKVAEELGFIYVDTGAMYRAIGVFCMEQGIDLTNPDQIASVARGADITITHEHGLQQVFLNGENITAKLRTEAAGNAASIVSAVKQVREHLLELQRGLAREADVVMDGRDIGTHILPHADLKIYLTASVKTRAERRFKELQEKGQICNLEEIAGDIRRRDERDMNREIAPLQQADDAVYLDSSELSISEVVQKILSYYQK